MAESICSTIFGNASSNVDGMAGAYQATGDGASRRQLNVVRFSKQEFSAVFKTGHFSL
jgi:hypothetical protein